MLNEFKAFIARGNVLDLAVGIIIGGAFTLIVNSMVNDIIMPVIGAITGGLDFFPTSSSPCPTRSRPIRWKKRASRAPFSLRQLHHRRHQLHHPRLDHLPAGQGGEPHARHAGA